MNLIEGQQIEEGAEADCQPPSIQQIPRFNTTGK
jgi:hypothetical protein